MKAREQVQVGNVVHRVSFVEIITNWIGQNCASNGVQLLSVEQLLSMTRLTTVVTVNLPVRLYSEQPQFCYSRMDEREKANKTNLGSRDGQ